MPVCFSCKNRAHSHIGLTREGCAAPPFQHPTARRAATTFGRAAAAQEKAASALSLDAAARRSLMSS